MPLSEEEQRLLAQMEQALAAEDPKFVSVIRGATSRARHKRLAILSAVGFFVGIAVLMTGAVVTMTVVSVAGFVIMLGCGYLAITQWRRMGDPDVPENSKGSGKGNPGKNSGPRAARPHGFMNRMEDRWHRRHGEM